MAFSHGSTAVFKITDSGSTLRDISAYLKSVKFPEKVSTAKTTSLSNTAEAYIPGLYDRTISGDGTWDPTPDGYLYGILRATSVFEYFPAGTATGNIKYTGTLILTSYDIDSPVENANTFSFQAQITGTVTRSVNA